MAAPKVFAAGLNGPETPRLLPDGSWLCVEMGGGGVTHISADGKTKRQIAETGRPQGLAIDKDGIIWVAESGSHPSLVRVTIDGETEVIVDKCNGEPFLLPNDLCFGPDGALYMTDSGILINNWAPGGQLRPDWMDAEFDGRVYRIDPKTKEVTKLDSGIKFTNGIAIGLDGDVYANEMITGMVYRYPIKDGKLVGERENYGNVMDQDWPGEGFRGPDGMAFGADGNLYCTVFGQGDVTVLAPDGSVVTRIKTSGAFPTNIAFGPGDEKKIYVTEVEKGQIEVFEVDTPGAPLYYG